MDGFEFTGRLSGEPCYLPLTKDFPVIQQQSHFFLLGANTATSNSNITPAGGTRRLRRFVPFGSCAENYRKRCRPGEKQLVVVRYLYSRAFLLIVRSWNASKSFCTYLRETIRSQ